MQQRNLCRALAVCGVFALLAGCGAREENDSMTARMSAADAADSAAGAAVQRDGTIEKTFTDADGAALLTVSVVRPDLSGYLTGDALRAAAAYYDGVYQAAEVEWRTLADAARDDRALDAERFHAYAVYEDTTVPGEGENYVSVMRTSDVNSGGVHGNVTIACEVFRKSDGVRLTLDDLFASADYRNMLLEKLSALAESRAADNGYFDNAGQNAVDSFDPDAFYLSGSGVTFLYGCYALAPYAAGPQALTLPYDELPDFVMP